MSASEVIAVAFDSEIVEQWLGSDGLECSTYKIVELSNSRKLIIDDSGVMDRADVDPHRERLEQQFFYLSWDELLAALDAQRALGAN